MSWDIYGQPLARGQCEVHPHIHEEYPLDERQRHEQNQHQDETVHNMQEEVDRLKDYCADLRNLLSHIIENTERVESGIYQLVCHEDFNPEDTLAAARHLLNQITQEGVL